MSDDVIRTLGSREVYRNRWMSLREDDIELPDGTRGIYSVVDKPDFALVIPRERGGFHLVQQYRYPVAGRYWEFPQGSFGVGKSGDSLDMARAELAEETGLRAGAMTHLGHLFCAHGTSSQGFDVYLAEDLEPGEPDREVEEQDMIQCWVTHAEFDAMVRDGRIRDDSTLAAYTLMTLAERST